MKTNRQFFWTWFVAETSDRIRAVIWVLNPVWLIVGVGLSGESVWGASILFTQDRGAGQPGNLQDPALELPVDGLTQTPTIAEADAQGRQVFEILVQELLNMIPFALEEDSEPRQMIDSAVTAFQSQDFNKASDILGELSEKHAGFPPSDLLRATLSYAIRDAENGLALLERAAIEHPGYPGIYSALGRLAFNQGRISDALAQFEKCQRMIQQADLNEKAAEYFNQQYLDGMIDIAMRQRRFDDARTYLGRQLRNLPDNLKVLMNFAELEFNVGNLEKSEQYLKAVKQSYPDTRAPETIFATWFDQQGKREEAGKWVQAAAEKYPNDPQVQLEYASYLINVEKLPQASKAINDAEKIMGESLFSRNLKGRIAFFNQSYGVAEAHYKAISDEQPNNFDAMNMYALSLIESQDAEKRERALNLARRTFQLYPDNGVAALSLGYIHLKRGEISQAREIFSRVNVSVGVNSEIDYFIAYFFHVIGEKDRARTLLNSILERDGSFLYRKSAQQILESIGPAESDLPDPANQ